MRILYVSDVSLYNHIRIEKAANTVKKIGWKTYFSGPQPKKNYTYALDENIFIQTFNVLWNKWVRLAVPLHYNQLKRKLKKVIERVKPDIIHAYNIFSAKIIQELGYPFVFEDAELYSLKKRSDVEWNKSNFFDKKVAKYLKWKLTQWENDVAEVSPVITVSENIAKVYAKMGTKTFVVPNYPSLLELSKVSFQKKADVFTIAYVGNDVSNILRAYRDTSGLIGVVRDINLPFIVIGDNKLSSKGLIRSYGFIPHLKLYTVLSRCHIGIVPWRKHWLHKYLNPNKPYLYAHSGLVVVVPSSLIEVINTFKNNCRTIDHISDLKNLVFDFSEIEDVIDEGRRIRDYARRNLIWELYEKRIIEAYKIV